jgi:hypothetical protein
MLLKKVILILGIRKITFKKVKNCLSKDIPQLGGFFPS